MNQYPEANAQADEMFHAVGGVAPKEAATVARKLGAVSPVTMQTTLFVPRVVREFALQRDRRLLPVPCLCHRKPVPRLTRSESLRRRLYEAQGGLCAYCDLPFPITAMTKDHIVPKIKGGTDDPQNIALACQGCNTFKSGWESLEEVLNYADRVVAQTDEKIRKNVAARHQALRLVVFFKRLRDKGYISR